MRIFIAALGTETNTFSPLPTGRKTFEETLWVRRDASLSSDNYFVLPLREWRRLAEAAGDEVIESLSAFAQPAGRTVQAVWEELRDTLLGDLRAAGPLDLVLLNLHGAMASEQCDDCEGELVEMVRQVVGPEVTVGVEFDLHCHISERLMRSADLLVLYKEYPHTDVAERGAELFELARRTVLGEIRPVMALRDLRMLDVWRTSDAPVRELVDWMQAAEQRDKVLSVSFGHGFPWADVPDVGAKTVVVTDGDPDLAEAVAKELGDRIWALRETYKANLLDVAETMAAIRAGQIERGSVIVVRNVGPVGGPGMPEMVMLTIQLQGRGLGEDVALITDGRFSGVSHGILIGHISPEAARGGPIAAVRDGDTIVIDPGKRTLNVELSDAEIAKRLAEWRAPDRAAKLKPGSVHDKYVKLVSSAHYGCVV